MKIEAVLFDADGVLILPEEVFSVVYAKSHGLSPAPFDQFFRESFDDSQKALWREGLRLVDVMSRHYHSKSFVEASPEDRIAVLAVLSDHEQMTDLPEVRFFLELKRLTVRGYYTSKIGIHDELEYKGNRILQEFVGCDDPTPQSS